MFRKNLSLPIDSFPENGREFWLGYEEWCDSEEMKQIIEKEFPVSAGGFSNSVSRRHFLKIMGASLALAGLTNCTPKPLKKIISFVKAPEGLIPGQSVFYARSLNRGSFAVGVLVESYMGRPIKIEGNPEHPMSLGASDIFLQSEILNLYDPDRFNSPLKKNVASSWVEFQNEWKKRSAIHDLDGGMGLRVMCERSTSETYLHLQMDLLKRYPKAKIISYDPVCRDLLREATKLCFNQYLEPLYDFKKAQVILSIDRDFLNDEAAGLRYSRDFSDNRRIDYQKNKTMNRLYCMESDFTITGSMADHRLNRSRFEIEQLIIRLALKLDVPVGKAYHLGSINQLDEKWISSVARDLQNHKGSSLIVGSETLGAEFQALIFLMNEKIKNTGTTLHFVRVTDINDSKERQKLKSLTEEMNRGDIKSLIIISHNPVYHLPQDLNFSTSLKNIEFTVSASTLRNETSEKCLWSLPLCHSLESWSDARAIDGTLTINQPLISPLVNSWSAIELLSFVLNEKKIDGHQLVKNYWAKKIPLALFDNWWESTLRLGKAENSTYQPEAVRVTLKKDLVFSTHSPNQIELHLKEDPSLRDGQFANNGWLQELPKPMTKLCWSNAALVSPHLATQNNIKNGDVIKIQTQFSSLDVPVWIVPGLAINVIILHFGHGRKIAGRVGTKNGYDAYVLLQSNALDNIIKNVKIIKTNTTKELACTQLHHAHQSTEPLKVREYKDLSALKKEEGEPKSFLKSPPIPVSNDYAWGMSIDLNVCTGCNACVIGCQAENNIPIVGEAEVIHGREMHWIRVDRYFEGVPDLAKAYFQPLACVHCEKAPCEVVCPVAATSHSSEGINQMVYNRCVGTRYCSNNCPYKVRRFNFLEYNNKKNEFLKLRSNPDVSVRAKGVMEKCTYCIQRINEVRVKSDLEGRKIKDGEIKTACEQACATKAIVFGNLLDPHSEVSKLQNSVQSYELLGELGTKPRTRYLTRFRNPHPDLDS